MENDDRTWRFSGFRSPNFTSVPDEFFDELAPRLNGGEVKVLLYIIRRTFGFKKERDSISLSQMLNGIVKKNGDRLDYGTGMSKPSVCRALNTLEEKLIITTTKQFDFKGGCVATSYQLNMNGSTAIEKPSAPIERGSEEGEGTPGKKMRQGGESHILTRPLVKKRDTQYTVNKLQNNVNVATEKKRGGILYEMDDQFIDVDHSKLIAEDILTQLGDRHSFAFYRLVAKKVPEHFIRRILAEIRQGETDSPAKVFTSAILDYARSKMTEKQKGLLEENRQALVSRLRRQ